MTTRYLPLHLVNRTIHTGDKGKLINSSLIVIQVSVFTFLMIMLFITTKQLKYIQNKNWGFESEQLIKIALDGNPNPEKYQDFKNRLDNIPAVISLSGCRHIPPSYSIWFYGYIDDNGDKVMIEFNDVDYPYIKTLGLSLTAGRDFNETLDDPAQNKIIVNQQFLDLKEIKNPLDTFNLTF